MEGFCDLLLKVVRGVFQKRFHGRCKRPVAIEPMERPTLMAEEFNQLAGKLVDLILGDLHGLNCTIASDLHGIVFP